MGGSSMLFGLLGFVGTLVVLGLLALLVFALVRRARHKGFDPVRMGHAGHPQPRPPMPPALQILDERLANGDIEVEDYMTRRAALLGGASPSTNEWTPQAPPPSPDPQKPASDDDPAS